MSINLKVMRKLSKFRTAAAILLGSLAFACLGQQSPKLIPFQGRLTDQNGVAVSDGVRLVQFKIYDSPVGGQAVWNGEVQKLTVNGGLVSTVLGSKASLGSVDFNKSLYLELTIDANNDNQITAADPPMLPRQAILPAVFSKESANSRLLSGNDWGALFGTNDPVNGKLDGSRIASNSITGSQIAVGAIGAHQIAQGGIQSSNLADSSVTSWKVASNSISPDHLTLRTVGTNVPAGGIAISASCGNFSSPTPSVPTAIPSFDLTLITRGNPVEIGFVPDGDVNNISYFLTLRNESPYLKLILLRDGNVIAQQDAYSGGSGVSSMDVPPGGFRFLDLNPSAGSHRYQVQMVEESASNGIAARFMRMMAREL